MDVLKGDRAELAVASLFDLCDMLAAESGGVEHTDAYDAYFVPETFWYHRVRLKRGLSASLSSVVAGIANAAASGDLPKLICYSEWDYPEQELPGILRSCGYELHTTQMAMNMSLPCVSGAEYFAQVDVMDPNELELWCSVTASNLGKTSESAGFWRLLGRNNCKFLTWRENGEIVGGLLLVCKGDHAGIHEVAVQKEYRGKGIASALVRCALDIASQNKSKNVSLQASEMGEPLYVKVGMEAVGHVFTWIHREAMKAEECRSINPK